MWMTLYSDTHQQPAEPAAEMEVTGSATQIIRVHSAACQQMNTILQSSESNTQMDMMQCGTVKATDTDSEQTVNADTEISTGSKVWS